MRICWLWETRSGPQRSSGGRACPSSHPRTCTLWTIWPPPPHNSLYIYWDYCTSSRCDMCGVVGVVWYVLSAICRYWGVEIGEGVGQCGRWGVILFSAILEGNDRGQGEGHAPCIAQNTTLMAVAVTAVFPPPLLDWRTKHTLISLHCEKIICKTRY